MKAVDSKITLRGMKIENENKIIVMDNKYNFVSSVTTDEDAYEKMHINEVTYMNDNDASIYESIDEL